MTISTSPMGATWTIGDLLDWLAADDDRSRDDTLQPLLREADRRLGSSRDVGGLVPGTVALVRSIAVAVRAEPGLRDLALTAPEPAAGAAPVAEPSRPRARAPRRSLRRLAPAR